MPVASASSSSHVSRSLLPLSALSSLSISLNSASSPPLAAPHAPHQLPPSPRRAITNLSSDLQPPLVQPSSLSFLSPKCDSTPTTYPPQCRPPHTVVILFDGATQLRPSSRFRPNFTVSPLILIGRCLFLTIAVLVYRCAQISSIASAATVACPTVSPPLSHSPLAAGRRSYALQSAGLLPWLPPMTLEVLVQAINSQGSDDWTGNFSKLWIKTTTLRDLLRALISSTTLDSLASTSYHF